MKAYRRGDSIDIPRQLGTILWWFGTGSLPAWQFHGGLIRHYRYRGRHRANRSSRRVSDIEADLAAKPSVREYIDEAGCVWLEFDMAMFRSPSMHASAVIVAPAASGGLAGFPALYPTGGPDPDAFDTQPIRLAG